MEKATAKEEGSAAPPDADSNADAHPMPAQPEAIGGGGSSSVDGGGAKPRSDAVEATTVHARFAALAARIFGDATDEGGDEAFDV